MPFLLKEPGSYQVPSDMVDEAPEESSINNQENSTQEETLLPAGTVQRRGFRYAAASGSAVALLCLIGFIGKSFQQPVCIEGPKDVAGFVELYQTEEHSVRVLDDEDADALLDIFVKSMQAGEDDNKTLEPPAMNEIADVANNVFKVHEVPQNGDPEKKATTDKFNEVVQNTLAVTAKKREALAGFVKEARQSRLNFSLNHVPKAKFPGTPTPIQQHYRAACVFSVMQATTFAAEYALDIYDSAKTCPGFKRRELNGKIACVANMGLVFESIAFIAGMLALAADQCAATIIPDVDAACAAAISAVIGQVGQLGGGAALAALSCGPRAYFRRLPQGVTPSNFGSVPGYGSNRWLQGDDEAKILKLAGNRSNVPGRRLIIGGGLESTAGHCAVDSLEIAWWLAQFAIAINEAANPKVLKRCPPRGLIPLTGNSGPVFDILRDYCLFDIAAAIFTFNEALAFIQLAIIHCSNDLSPDALCGTGINFVLGGMAGIAGSAGAMKLSCVKFQGSVLHSAIYGARAFDDWTDGVLTKTIGNTLDTLGRRLEMAKSFEEKMEKLKQRFETPADVFQHLNFDITDVNATWRKNVPGLMKKVVDLATVPEEARAAHAKGEPMMKTCRKP